MEESNSIYIAKLLGPALVGITVTEWINLDVFSAAIGSTFGPHVYLNGTLIFVAGLAIVRAHNVWSWSWTVLVTLLGWLAIVLGLGRMVAPLSAQQASQSKLVVHSSIVSLLAIGLFLTNKAYTRSRK